MEAATSKISDLKGITTSHLVKILVSVPEPKDLVIDPQLMKPLDHFAGASFLKKHGVSKIFKLEERLDAGCDKRIYLLRPELLLTKFVADHVNNDKKSGKSRSYKIVYVPKKLYVCEMILEQEGVYGDVSLEEFKLEFIPLDEDVLTLELPSFLKDYFLEGDQTPVSFVARALATLQHFYGAIPTIYGLGNCAKMVGELLKNIEDEGGEYKPDDRNQEIGSLVLIDREIDFITPMCSQVTYAGVVDDSFGIKSGVVEFGPEVTGKDQTTKMLLNDQDKVFSEIRDRHFSNVLGYLSQKAKEVQSGYDKRQHLSTVRDVKQFVSGELGGLRQQHKGLAIHIGACEAVLKAKTKEDFERRLRAEHGLLEQVEDKSDIEYVENCIIKRVYVYKTMQIMCLLSLTRGGIEPKLCQTLKHRFLQSFGHEHMLTFSALKQLGLFTELDAQKKNLFKNLSKRLNLIPKDAGKVDLKNPTEMAYVFSGAYTPISCRLVEQVLSDGLPFFEEISKVFGVAAFSSRMTASARSNSSASGALTRSKCVLVMFLGGCTFSEISAIRLLSNKLGYRIIVGTTAIINGTRLLESISTY
ncbi:vacuolar protein sorting-associated protein 33B-like isoform X1 [Acropora muricata]|uniref:vacuolar protein sorting-associated protein 33B-like isoform X1 n=3 Tax=Acropora muricata TaxID=159855 RepID=UPI0034E478F5